MADIQYPKMALGAWSWGNGSTPALCPAPAVVVGGKAGDYAEMSH